MVYSWVHSTLPHSTRSRQDERRRSKAKEKQKEYEGLEHKLDYSLRNRGKMDKYLPLCSAPLLNITCIAQALSLPRTLELR